MKNRLSLTVGTLFFWCVCSIKAGMTWEEWVNSDYNTGNYYINDSLITVGDGNYIMTDYLDTINLSSVITDSTAYIYGNHPV